MAVRKRSLEKQTDKDWKRCMEGFKDGENVTTPKNECPVVSKLIHVENTIEVPMEDSDIEISQFSSATYGFSENEDNRACDSPVFNNRPGIMSHSPVFYTLFPVCRKTSSEANDTPVNKICPSLHNSVDPETFRTTYNNPAVTGSTSGTCQSNSSLSNTSPCIHRRQMHHVGTKKSLSPILGAEYLIDKKLGCEKLPCLEEAIKSDEFSISDFESDCDEDDHIDELEGTLGAGDDIDESIITMVDSPVISPPDSVPMIDNSRLKGKMAGDWLKDIVTPTKCTNEATNDDSTKKKPKYIKDGLAERMKKLQTRERTSVAFWNHQLAHKSNEFDLKDKHKTLTIEVVSMELEYSLYKAISKILDGHITERSRGHDLATVLFSRSTVNQLKVVAGSIVRIHPPWQKLTIPNSDGVVILCTNYSELVSNPTPNKTHGVQTNLERTLLATWQCPCSKDPGINIKDCAAKDVIDHPSTDITPNTNQSQSHHGLSVFSPPVCRVLDSILEYVENNGRVLALRATIQRMFQWRDDGMPCGAMMIQDCYGVFSCVILPASCLNKHIEQFHLSEGTEGHWCVFHKLEICQRTTRNRSPEVFSLVDSIWNPGRIQRMRTSQSSQESPLSIDRAVLPSAPGFCYILTIPEGSIITQCLEVDHQQVPSDLYTPPTYTSIKTYIFNQDNPPSRISIRGRALFISQGILYVGDADADNDELSTDITTYVRVHVAFCHHDILDSISGAVLLKDVYSMTGKLSVDKYSRIIHQLEDKIPGCIRLPELNSTSKEGDLISISGIIVGVDKKSTYSCIVCDQCADINLSVGNESRSTFLFCHQCKSDVTEPTKNMKPVVHVINTEYPLYKITIKLLESTILSILQSTEIEECDLDNVLEKTVGRLNCYVETKQTDLTGNTYQIQLHEITLL